MSKFDRSSRPSIFDWKKWPGGSEYAKRAYSSTVLPSSSELPPTPTSTFFVIVLITLGRSNGPVLALI